MNIRTTTAALALLAASVSAMAEVKVNENFSVTGYASGLYDRVDTNAPGVDSEDETSLNTAFLAGTFNFQPVSGTVSVLYRDLPSGAPDRVALLDAYLTYKAADGISFTAGKFLSYMGYEAFHTTSMDQISYANGDLLAPIPGFHTGARVDYAGATSSSSFAIVDSSYSPHGPTKGDGEIKRNAGFEYHYSYTGIKDLTLWAGAAYDTAGGFQGKNSVLTLDFWASYKINDKLRVAAEYVHKNGGPGDEGHNWLTFLNYSINEKVSCSFRISGEKANDYDTGAGIIDAKYTKYTISPAYSITKNILARAEYSTYKLPAGIHVNYLAFQTLFKF